MTKRLVVSTPFSGKVNNQTGEVLPEFRAEIQALLSAIRQSNEIEVYCALEAEGWVISDLSPASGVKKDLAEIDAADAVLALLLSEVSWGAQYEMGYAAASGKQVIVATPQTITLPYFYQGLVSLKYINQITYNSVESLAKDVQQICEE